jgi:hypothetical protein
MISSWSLTSKPTLMIANNFERRVLDKILYVAGNSGIPLELL